MQRENRFKNIQERMEGMRARPTVALLVDEDSVYTELPEAAEDATISSALMEVASAIGRVTHAAVYYEDGNRDPSLSITAWTAAGFDARTTPEDAVTEDGVNLPMLFDAHDLGKRHTHDVYVLAVGATNYNALVRRIIGHGAAVVLVSNYGRGLRTLPKESCVYMPLRSLVEAPTAEKKQSVVARDYDFQRFVRVLAESELRMPFVSAKYFVTRVMWRLKDLRTHDEKQAVFQEAAERGLVEFYEQDNIDGSDNKVSACRLNRTNELVTQVLKGADTEPADNDSHVIVVTIDGPETTATFPATSSEQTPTL